MVEWSKWSRQLLIRQYRMLEESAMRLKGRKEVEVIENFGKPDRISGPDEVRQMPGKVIKLDKHLRYFSIPHVKIIFGVRRGKVCAVIIIPMVRAGTDKN